MPPDFPLILQLLALGLAVGLLAGLLGVGGGLIQVPALSFILAGPRLAGADVLKVAVATSLATIVFTSLASVRAHHRRGSVRWDVLRGLSPGLLLGVVAGAAGVRWVPSVLLGLLFCGFALHAAQRLWRQPARVVRQRALTPARLWLAGTAVGAVATMIGAGGAFLVVPFLTRHGVHVREAVGTAAAVGLPIALAGTASHMAAAWPPSALHHGLFGPIHLPALGCMAAASMLAAPAGVRLAHRLETRALLRGFAALLVLMSAAMLWRLLPGAAA